MASDLTHLLLCKDFFRGVHSQCCYTLLQLGDLPISMIRVKGIQIGDYEIKIVKFADDTTIFLRDITCYNKTQVILKLLKMHVQPVTKILRQLFKTQFIRVFSQKT